MATSTNRLQINVSADAKEAVAAFKSLSESMKDMGKGSEEAATQASKVGDALSKLEKSLDNPARLGKAVGAAAMKMQDLKDAMVAAGIVGDKVPAALVKQFEKVDRVLEAASKRARQYADTVGDFKTRGDIAAKGFEGLAGRVGSLDGAMSLAMDSGSKLGAAIGTAGFAALAAKPAYDLLRSVLDELNGAYKKTFDGIADWSTKGKMAEADLVKMSNACRVLGKELPITAGNIALMANAFDAMIPNAKRAGEQLDNWVKTVDGVKIPKAFTEITDAAVKMEAKLADAWAKGKTEVIAFGTENRATLDAIAARYRIQGEEVPEWIGKTIKALDEWGKAEGRRKQAEEAAKLGQVDKLKALTLQHDLMVRATSDVEKYIVQANDAGSSDAERASGLADLAAKYGLTADGLEELVTKGLAYKKSVADAATSNDTFGGSFDRLNQKIQDSIDKQDKLNRKVSGSYDRGSQDAANFGRAIEGASAAQASGARTSIEAAMAAAKAGVATAKTVEDYAAFASQVESLRKQESLLAVEEERLAVAHGTSTNALRDLHGATESFTEYLPTSTKGLRDFASAVEGPIDSMGKLAQQFTFLSDSYASSASIWIEPLITDLEAGRIGIDKFREALENMKGAVGMMSAWSFASVKDYQNMLQQMAAAEQEYFDKSRKQAEQAMRDAQRMRDEAAQAKYEADVAAGHGSGMGDSSGGNMGSSSSANPTIHRTAGMSAQQVSTAIQTSLKRI